MSSVSGGSRGQEEVSHRLKVYAMPLWRGHLQLLWWYACYGMLRRSHIRLNRRKGNKFYDKEWVDDRCSMCTG